MDQVPQPLPTIVGADDAALLFSELIDRAEHGEEIVITRDGRAVARLVPGAGHDVAKAVAAVERLTAVREAGAARGVRVTQEEIRAMRDEGRR